MVYTKCGWKYQLLLKDKRKERRQGRIALKTRYRGNSGLTRWYYRYQHFGKRVRKKHFTTSLGVHCFECGNWIGDKPESKITWRMH